MVFPARSFAEAQLKARALPDESAASVAGFAAAVAAQPDVESEVEASALAAARAEAEQRAEVAAELHVAAVEALPSVVEEALPPAALPVRPAQSRMTKVSGTFQHAR